MNSLCRALEPLLSLHATGALDPEEAARLDAHLASCPSCRAALASERELLDLVRLPEPTAAESLALADLPSRTLGALRRRERRRGWGRRLMVGGAVAAGLLLALTAPAFLRTRTPTLAPAELQAATQVAQVASAAAWEVPDTGSVFADASASDAEDDAAVVETLADAALDAFDAGAGI